MGSLKAAEHFEFPVYRALTHPVLLEGTTEISGDDAFGRHRTKGDGK